MICDRNRSPIWSSAEAELAGAAAAFWRACLAGGLRLPIAHHSTIPVQRVQSQTGRSAYTGKPSWIQWILTGGHALHTWLAAGRAGQRTGGQVKQPSRRTHLVRHSQRLAGSAGQGLQRQTTASTGKYCKPRTMACMCLCFHPCAARPVSPVAYILDRM